MSAIQILLRPKVVEQGTGNIWFYDARSGNQSMTDCQATGFFNSIKDNRFRVGDLIYINATDGHGIYTIDNLNGDINITPPSSNTELATETSNGLMSFVDYKKLLYITTANQLKDADIDNNNSYHLTPEMALVYCYMTTKTPNIFLPDVSADPNKTSYNYDGDTWSIENNLSSAKSIFVKSDLTIGGQPITIYDPVNGVVSQVEIKPNVTVLFRWCDNNIDPNNRTNPVRWEILN
jgi:hypothetical protein